MCPKTPLLAYMKLHVANINDNLSNYIFQSVVKTNTFGCKLHKSRNLSYTIAKEILLGNLDKSWFA